MLGAELPAAKWSELRGDVQGIIHRQSDGSRSSKICVPGTVCNVVRATAADDKSSKISPTL